MEGRSIQSLLEIVDEEQVWLLWNEALGPVVIDEKLPFNVLEQLRIVCPLSGDRQRCVPLARLPDHYRDFGRHSLDSTVLASPKFVKRLEESFTKFLQERKAIEILARDLAHHELAARPRLYEAIDRTHLIPDPGGPHDLSAKGEWMRHKERRWLEAIQQSRALLLATSEREVAEKIRLRKWAVEQARVASLRRLEMERQREVARAASLAREAAAQAAAAAIRAAAEAAAAARRAEAEEAAVVRKAAIRRQEIRELVSRRGISRLVHFTRIENLKNIFTHGVLSRDSMRRRDVSAVINDYERWDGHLGASNLSIEFPNFKLFHTFRGRAVNSRWAVLELDVRVLWDCECAFYEENAASGYCRSLSLEKSKEVGSLDNLFSERSACGPERRHLQIPDAFPTNPQAEVLVFGQIPPECIARVVFQKESDLLSWDAEAPDLRSRPQLRVSGELFGYRCDSRWWFESCGPDAYGDLGADDDSDDAWMHFLS